MKYDIEFEYKLLDGGVVTLDADDPDHAEYLADKHVREAFTDALDISIISVIEARE